MLPTKSGGRLFVIVPQSQAFSPKNNKSPNTPDQYIYVEEFDENLDAKFLADVASPYFKTLFLDVAKRSVSPRTADSPENFVDNVAFFEYTKLPGIICDRFFNIFKRTKSSNWILEKDFVTGFLCVYLSSIQVKMELTFKM